MRNPTPLDFAIRNEFSLVNEFIDFLNTKAGRTIEIYTLEMNFRQLHYFDFLAQEHANKRRLNKQEIISNMNIVLLHLFMPDYNRYFEQSLQRVGIPNAEYEAVKQKARDLHRRLVDQEAILGFDNVNNAMYDELLRQGKDVYDQKFQCIEEFVYSAYEQIEARAVEAGSQGRDQDAFFKQNELEKFRIGFNACIKREFMRKYNVRPGPITPSQKSVFPPGHLPAVKSVWGIRKVFGAVPRDGADQTPLEIDKSSMSSAGSLKIAAPSVQQVPEEEDIFEDEPSIYVHEVLWPILGGAVLLGMIGWFWSRKKKKTAVSRSAAGYDGDFLRIM
jgi:LPXTG-motif cell wall-anchored protein